MGEALVVRKGSNDTQTSENTKIINIPVIYSDNTLKKGDFVTATYGYKCLNNDAGFSENSYSTALGIRQIGDNVWCHVGVDTSGSYKNTQITIFKYDPTTLTFTKLGSYVDASRGRQIYFISDTRLIVFETHPTSTTATNKTTLYSISTDGTITTMQSISGSNAYKIYSDSSSGSYYSGYFYGSDYSSYVDASNPNIFHVYNYFLRNEAASFKDIIITYDENSDSITVNVKTKSVENGEDYASVCPDWYSNINYSCTNQYGRKLKTPNNKFIWMIVDSDCYTSSTHDSDNGEYTDKFNKFKIAVKDITTGDFTLSDPISLGVELEFTQGTKYKTNTFYPRQILSNNKALFKFNKYIILADTNLNANVFEIANDVEDFYYNENNSILTISYAGIYYDNLYVYKLDRFNNTCTLEYSLLSTKDSHSNLSLYDNLYYILISENGLIAGLQNDSGNDYIRLSVFSYGVSIYNAPGSQTLMGYTLNSGSSGDMVKVVVPASASSDLYI